MGVSNSRQFSLREMRVKLGKNLLSLRGTRVKGKNF